MRTSRVARARMLARTTGAAALMATQTGCALFGRCTFEDRNLQAGGDFNEGGLAAHASVTVSETRGSISQGDIHAIVTGSALSGHVLATAVKDVGGSLPPVPLTVFPAGSTTVAEGGADKTTVDLGAYHDLIASGKAVVELKTDILSNPTILIPLVPTSGGGWFRPNCS